MGLIRGKLLLLLIYSLGYTQALLLRNAQSVNFERLMARRALLQNVESNGPQTVLTNEMLKVKFPAQTFPQLLDHDNTSAGTFEQRYWVNAHHYRPGGPVIVIDGGETSGEDRLPFLDTGIAEILAEATHGLGIVLEHRYYGESIPVKDLSTDSLRWLNNAQSLADSAYFMSNVKISSRLFPKDIPESSIANLTALNTPWIYYGGSYAGARAAHMRKLYPDIVFGAIASSAVTYATINNWEYMDIIRTAAPQACSTLIQSSMTQIDSLLANSTLRTPLKALFGLRGLQHDDDFVSVLSWPLGSFQGKNWDPKVGSTGFEEFCAKLVDEDDIDAMESEREATRLGLPVDLVIFRYAKYIRALVDQLCPNTEEQEDCFGTHNASKFQGTSLQETWRLWIFQVCTEWGYFIPAPPDPEWPSMISRLIDLEFESKICRQAFPPGKHMTIPMWPNVTVVNELGGFGLTYPRLAFIDGEIDPWRPCTPHSRWAPPRNDTISKPFKLIPGGVHHHDQNGLRKHKKEPKHIQEIHREEIEFVQAWLKEWIPK